jgi:hypothetical protein
MTQILGQYHHGSQRINVLECKQDSSDPGEGSLPDVNAPLSSKTHGKVPGEIRIYQLPAI